MKKDFKRAVELLVLKEGSYEDRVKQFIDENPKRYIEALRKVPHKILLLFVHSYQSFVFNETIKKLEEDKFVSVPLVGFGVEYNSLFVETIIQEVLKKDEISERDFIIPSIPDISCEGGERAVYVELKDLKIGELEKDELNSEKFKIKLSFSLSKGAYATNVVKSIIL